MYAHASLSVWTHVCLHLFVLWNNLKIVVNTSHVGCSVFLLAAWSHYKLCDFFRIFFVIFVPLKLRQIQYCLTDRKAVCMVEKKKSFKIWLFALFLRPLPVGSLFSFHQFCVFLLFYYTGKIILFQALFCGTPSPLQINWVDMIAIRAGCFESREKKGSGVSDV